MVKNSPSCEIRITDLNDEKSVFSYQSIRVKNDTVTGGQAVQEDGALQNIPNHPACSVKRKTIPISSIRKMAVLKR